MPREAAAKVNWQTIQNIISVGKKEDALVTTGRYKHSVKVVNSESKKTTVIPPDLDIFKGLFGSNLLL